MNTPNFAYRFPLNLKAEIKKIAEKNQEKISDIITRGLIREIEIERKKHDPIK